MTDTPKPAQPFCGDDHDPSALQPDVARQRILDAITPLGAEATECLSLLQALDRVLAEDIVAPINVPPHDNSAMDGYALNAGDIPMSGTAELTVVGNSFAGHPYMGNCASGECIRIMTGAVIPAGLDTVIPQEKVEKIDDTSIRIDGRGRRSDNVRFTGEDICQGLIVLNRGRRITPADLGLIASLGIGQVAVMRSLRVAYLTTGDELRAIGETLQPGEIHDSNRYTLFGMLTHQNCQISDLGVVRDNLAELRAVLQSAANDYDVIIASGGVSVGEADLVRQALSEIGEINFWKVAMKPGRPLTFGRLQQAWFFGLPGNPVAVMVAFSQFVKPALQRLSAEISNPPLTLRAVSTSSLKKRAGRTEYQRGILSQNADGTLNVCKTGDQGSGILLSMSRANCFILMSDEQTLVESGSEVWVQPFLGLM